VIEKARAYLEKSLIKRIRAEGEDNAALIMKDKRVRVIKGRKAPHGTKGRVFWIGKGWRGQGTRVGVTTDAGETLWIDARNLEVVDPDQYYYTEEEIQQRAAYLASRSWIEAITPRPGMVVV